MKKNKFKLLSTGALLGTTLVGTVFAVSAETAATENNNTSNEAQTSSFNKYVSNRLNEFAKTKADEYKALIEKRIW
ncbi:Uncharacterised protein, partial [Mycoplasmopsis edwardii]